MRVQRQGRGSLNNNYVQCHKTKRSGHDRIHIYICTVAKMFPL